LIRGSGQRRRRAWRVRLRILALPACVVAFAMAAAGATAQGYTDLRSPDTRDAARAAQMQPPATDQSSESATPTIVHTSDDGSQTLPIVLSSMALAIALAGIGVALRALHRRPRPRWTAQ
jgi:hypothetical protein